MPLFVGSERIGLINVKRRSKVPEDVNLYDWEITLNAFEPIGRPATTIMNDPDEPISHHYDDGPLVLLAKVLEAAEVKV
jgi:hypothetical protein